MIAPCDEEWAMIDQRALRASISRLAWNDPTHTTSWHLNITNVARYQVHMSVRHGLARSFAYILANVEARDLTVALQYGRSIEDRLAIVAEKGN
jgi:hypothetical protein